MRNLLRDAEDATLDFDSWHASLPDDFRSSIGYQLQLAPDKEAEKRKLASTMWLSAQTGLSLGDVNERYEEAKGTWAAKQELPNDQWRDEATFQSTLKSKVADFRNERILVEDLSSQARRAALWDGSKLPVENRPEMSAWRRAKASDPGYKPDKASRYEVAFADQYHKERARLAPVSKVLNDTWSFLYDPREPTPIEIYDLSKTVADLPRDQQDTVLAGLAERANMLTEEERDTYLQRWGKAFSRGLDSLGSATILKQPMRMAADAAEKADQLSEGIGMGGTGGVAWAQKQRRVANIMGRLSALREERIDPNQGDNLLEKIGLGVAGSVPGLGMAVAMTPFSLYPLMADQAYTELEKSFRESGMDEDKADRYANDIAPFAGAAMTALEQVTFGFAKGPLAGVQRQLIQRLANSAAVTRFGAALGVETLEQFGQEIAQDSAPVIFAEAARMMGAEVPDQEVIDRVMQATTPETFGVSIVFALGGGGAMPQVEQTRALQALGFQPEAIDAVLAADTIPAKQAAFAEGQKTATPSQEGQDALRAIAEAEAAAEEEANRRAGIRGISRDSEGWWVNHRDGTRTKSSSAEAAIALRDDIGHAQDLAVAEQAVRIADWMAEKDPKLTQVFDNAAQVATEEGAFLIRPGEEPLLIPMSEQASAELQAELNRLRAQESEPGLMASILGDNIVTWKDGIRDDAGAIVESTVTRNLKGGTILTQLHERMESRFEALIGSQRMTTDEVVQAIRLLESALGTRMLGDVFSATDLRETAIELAVADVIGRRKDGTRVQAGSLSQAVKAEAMKSPEQRNALGKLGDFLRAVRAHVMATIRTAAAIVRARRSGKLKDGDEFSSFVDRLLGTDEQKAFDDQVVTTAEDLATSNISDPARQGFSIARATEQAREMRAEASKFEKDFFEKFWPKLLKQTSTLASRSEKGIRQAAEVAVAEVAEWLKTNRRFADYYDTDWRITTEILNEVFPVTVQDPEWVDLFRCISGLCSPSTKLPDNMIDAVNTLNVWTREGDLESVKIMISAKGNVKFDEKSSPFLFRSTTAANKARSLKILDTLVRAKGKRGAIEFLQEPVTSTELNVFNKEMGYKSAVGGIGAIRNVVREATGQDQLIPRMFIFGQKVGAYTLNAIGDARYTTTDIWEGRFIRSYFKGLFDTGTGLPENVDDQALFQSFATAFNEEFEKTTGESLSPSAAQAVRWFYMIDKARESGYRYAKTNETISEYTRRAVRELGLYGEGARGRGRSTQAGEGAAPAAGGRVQGFSVGRGGLEASFNFTVATARVPQVAKLLEEGRWEEVHRLNDIAVRHAMSDLPGVAARLEPVVGRFQGPTDAAAFQEPASRVTVTFKKESDLGAIRARMADLAELWDQDEFHEISQAPTTGVTEFGTTLPDGSTVQPSYAIETGDLSPEVVGEAALAAGVAGMSVAEGRVYLYNVGPDYEEFLYAVRAFTKNIDLRRGVQSQSQGSGIALRRYGRESNVSEGNIGYNDASVRDPAEAGSLNRLRTDLARKIPELVKRIFKAPEARSFFTAKDVTPRQIALQSRIADAFEAMPDNDLGNPLVRRAYEELNKDLASQWDVLTSGPDGLRFTFENYFRQDPLTGERIGGDLYRSSKDAVRDLRERRTLRVLKTDPGAFGPEGADFTGHPLLEDSGRVDADGTPLNYNDVLRAVHDALAHGMFSDQFGAVGEESAWNVHIRTIDNPWSRWALTSETRGQNSWVNYGPQMRAADGSLRAEGDHGYLSPQDRGFARQKAALLPLEFTLTGDKEVDAPTVELMEKLKPVEATGSRTGFSLSSRLDGVADALGNRRADPKQRRDWFEAAREQVAGMARAMRYNDSLTTTSPWMEMAHGREMAALRRRHKEELAAFVSAQPSTAEEHAQKVEALKAAHEFDLEAAKQDGWDATRRDALKQRQKVEMEKLKGQGVASRLGNSADIAKKRATLVKGHQRELLTMQAKHRQDRSGAASKLSAEANRKEMLRALSTLDAILMQFPSEVRGKVGGFTKLAGLTTTQAREDFLRQRIVRLDEVLETYLRREYTTDMRKLIDRAAPKGVAGMKPKGFDPDTHRLLQAVEQAMNQDRAAVDGRMADLDSQINSGTLTPEEEALAMREHELINLAGDWSKADSSRMAAALEATEETYEAGRLAWAQRQAVLRAERAQLGAALMTATGRLGTPEERQVLEAADNTRLGVFKKTLLSLSSFEEVMLFAFGDVPEVSEVVDRERAAANQYEDAVQSLGNDIDALFAQLAGDALAGERLRYTLSQPSVTTGNSWGTLSELQVIQGLLMWRQPDGQRHMGQFQINDAWIKNVEGQLSPEAVEVMTFISRRYADEWAILNPVFREAMGVDLPHNKLYAPLTVTPQQVQPGQVVDPVTGNAMSGSSLTPPSLRTRSMVATAEPQFRDALATLIGHNRQIQHWMAYQALVRDLNVVIGNRNLLNSVEARGGEQARKLLLNWVQVLSQGGSRDAAAGDQLTDLMRGYTGRFARMALVGRVGTLLIQSTQLAAAAAVMPTGAYVMRFGKLLAGQMSWRAALDSDFIRRRIAQAPPVVQQAMEGLRSRQPNMVKHAAQRLGMLISGADGLFTAGTYAIVFDYQRQELLAAGVNPGDVDALAHQETERIVERVAQPTRLATRSFFENVTTNPLAKLGWAFASEARQKLALAGWAAANSVTDPARAARAAFVVWGAGGLMAAIIRNAWRDARDDDDDETFDDKHWGLKRMTIQTLAGPLNGVPLWGDAVEALVNAVGKQPNLGDSKVSAVANAWPAVKRLSTLETFSDDEPVEQTLRDAESLLGMFGVFNETAASATSLWHVLRDGTAIVDGLDQDEKEEKMATERMQKQRVKEAKEARKGSEN